MWQRIFVIFYTVHIVSVVIDFYGTKYLLSVCFLISVQLFIDILDGLLAKTVVCSIDVRVTPQNYSTKENGTKQVMDASVM